MKKLKFLIPVTLFLASIVLSIIGAFDPNEPNKYSLASDASSIILTGTLLYLWLSASSK